MAHPMDMSGRTILVTGAARGIGRAIAEAARALGGQVAALDRKAPDWAVGDGMLALAADVRDPHACEAAVEQVVAQWGRLDGLVNNAGITRPAMADRMSEADWQAVIDVNLSGAFHMLQAAGRAMIARAKAGEMADRAIVNIASDAGRRGTVGQINYGAAKAGLVGLTMSAAREWARHGIRVNAASFGVVETDMTARIRKPDFRESYLSQIPLGRFATPEEVAPAVLFLLSGAACYITGQTLSVNGGWHIAA